MKWFAVCRHALASLALLVAVSAAAEETFRFFAIGDVPYTAPRQLDELIARINHVPSRFTLHVGDIKSGGSLCSDQAFEAVYRQFMSFERALIYTPGDNEWTDCHRKNNGPYDPIERLEKLRQIFFGTGKSLGRQPIAVESQSQDAGFHEFSENLRWHTSGVSFATLHMVGSNNNWQPELPSSSEFGRRNAANIAWMRSTFALAREKGHHAIVFAMQADTSYQDPRAKESGVAEWVGAFLKEAVDWGKPVLLIQGDTHRFTVDRPFEKRSPAASNVQRVIVPGEQDADVVLIDVDTSNADHPFSIRLLDR